MQEFLLGILTNTAFLIGLGLLAKKHIENYLDKRLDYELSKRLETHKALLNKEIEAYKVRLDSTRLLQEKYVKKNSEFMELLSEIRSAMQSLISAHLDEDHEKMAVSWDRYYRLIKMLEDFVARNQSPYLETRTESIKELAESINAITQALEYAKRNNDAQYNCDFQAVIDNCDRIKADIYQELTAI